MKKRKAVGPTAGLSDATSITSLNLVPSNSSNNMDSDDAGYYLETEPSPPSPQLSLPATQSDSSSSYNINSINNDNNNNNQSEEEEEMDLQNDTQVW